MREGSSDETGASDSEEPRVGQLDGGGPEVGNLALDSLRRADGPIPLVELACRVVAAENDCDPAAAPREEVQRVYLTLARSQIPRLERQGVVEYSAEDGTVQLAGPGTP